MQREQGASQTRHTNAQMGREQGKRLTKTWRPSHGSQCLDCKSQNTAALRAPDAALNVLFAHANVPRLSV